MERRLSLLFPGQVTMTMYEHPSFLKGFLLREVDRASNLPPWELPRELKTKMKIKTAKCPWPRRSKILIYLIQGGLPGWFRGIS